MSLSPLSLAPAFTNSKERFYRKRAPMPNPYGFLFLTSFTCIHSLLLRLLHISAAISQWRCTKKYRKHPNQSQNVPCSDVVMCCVSGRGQEGAQKGSDLDWSCFSSLLFCPTFYLHSNFFHVHLLNNFRQGWSVRVCVDVFVELEVWVQVAYTFFNTC